MLINAYATIICVLCNYREYKKYKRESASKDLHLLYSYIIFKNIKLLIKVSNNNFKVK